MTKKIYTFNELLKYTDNFIVKSEILYRSHNIFILFTQINDIKSSSDFFHQYSIKEFLSSSRSYRISLLPLIYIVYSIDYSCTYTSPNYLSYSIIINLPLLCKCYHNQPNLINDIDTGDVMQTLSWFS